MMKRNMRGLALVLTVLLAFQSFGFVAFAATDLKGHWSEVKMNDWINKGFIKGYPDGTVKPNNKITRAEFMAIVNKAFGFAGGYSASYSDIKSSDWYYSVIATAIAKGYIGGYPDGKMRPNSPITRAEAASIISKVANLTLDYTTASYYNDKSAIPTWALGAVGAVTKAGIMSGYTGGIFGPNRPITRAETVMALSKALEAQALGQQTYSTAGTYGPSTGTQMISGDVKITAASVNLRNMIVTGSLVIDQSVGNGNVALSNVVVQGQIFVNGGGVNSVAMENVSATSLYAARKDGMVRIIATGSTRFDSTFIQGDTRLEEAALSGGGFTKVYVNSDAPSSVDLEFVTVKLDSLSLKAKSTKTTFDSKSTATTVTISGTSNTLTTVSGTSIGTLVADAAVTVAGTGTITKAEINASGVSFDIKPATLTVKSGVSQPTITGSGIESWTPAKGATSVAIDSDIVIKFTETVRLESGNTALTNSNVDALINLRMKNSSGTKVPFDATVTTTSGKTVITINPTSDLALDQIYYVAIDFDAMEDIDNNDLLGDSNITFTTIVNGAPIVQTFEPLNGATNISVEGNLKITFSEKVRLITSNTDLTNSNVDNVIILKKTNSSGSNVSFDATVSTVSSKTVITINPDSSLSAGQVFYLAIKEDVLEDYSDIKLTGTKAASFTTILAAAPIVETYSPLNAATNVSPTANLTMTFNKEVRLVNDTALSNTNVDALVTLKETNSSGTAQTFDATVTVTSGKTVITVDPSTTLKSNQVYYLAVTGLEDLLGQALTGTTSITFTTMASGAPILESFSPVTNGALDANVVLTFSKEIRAVDDTTLIAGNVSSKLGIVFKKDNASGADIAYTATVSTVSNKTIVTLDPTASLDSGTTYYVAFDNVEDTSNQALIGSKNFSFTTIPVLVTSVTVAGTSGVNTITTDDGTLTMLATVLPANATNKAVTWSVRNDTGTASINASTGVLTALTNGNVYVKATSVSTPAIVSPEVIITLSNQTVQALGLAPVLSVASPLEWEKVLLTVATAAQASHKIYYHLTDSNPSAMAVGAVVDPSSWTEVTVQTAVKISAADGKYVEVIELSGANAVTKWGKTGTTDDGLKEISSAKAISDIIVQQNNGKTLDAIKADLGATVVLKVGSEEVAVPVTWDTPAYDNTIVGTYTLTGTIGALPSGFVDSVDTITSVSASIKVEALTLQSITVKTNPTKMTYVVGEALDTAGIAVDGIYNFGANQDVTGSVAFTGFDSSTPGSSIVIVTLTGKTTSFTVTINPVPSP